MAAQLLAVTVSAGTLKAPRQAPTSLPREYRTRYRGPLAVVREVSPVARPRAETGLAAMLAPLSEALDLAEGQAPGHALRSAVIALRIGEALGMSDAERGLLLYATLLKDLGGSANAALVSRLFDGDDREIKRSWRLTDWGGIRGAAGQLFDCGRPGASRLNRTWNLRVSRSGFAESGHVMMIAKAERGAELVRKLGLPAKVAEAVAAVDEHWDGRGMPRGLRASGIPMLARVTGLAQVVEVFATSGGVREAYGVAHARRGRWFDPVVVDCLDSFQMDARFWSSFVDGTASADLSIEDSDCGHRLLDEDGADGVVELFAGVIDAKRPCRAGHSYRVADIAGAVAVRMGVPARDRRTLRRAALLHDLGTLAVSSTILEKVEPLSGEEIAAIREHADGAADILGRVPRLDGVAEIVRRHTERLDGSGYPAGRTASSIPLPARILAVADVADALSHERPNRRGFAPGAVVGRLREMAAAGLLCPAAVETAAGVIAPEEVVQ